MPDEEEKQPAEDNEMPDEELEKVSGGGDVPPPKRLTPPFGTQF